MNKPTLQSKKETKKEKLEQALDMASVISAVICAILIIDFFGYMLLKIFHPQAPSFIYNFIIGFGTLGGIAFICAIIQEIFEK